MPFLHINEPDFQGERNIRKAYVADDILRSGSGAVPQLSAERGGTLMRCMLCCVSLDSR